MRKISLRSEHLGELSTDDLRRIAGGEGGAAGTISGGTCVCSILIPGEQREFALCDISNGSCACC